MFSALIKAFTGRAGFLSSLLALSIIALTAAAVLLSLPRIEQRLENSGQAVLSEFLGDNDSLLSIRADGRELLLEGRFEDAAALSAKLSEIEGLRSVRINGMVTNSAMSDESDAPVVEAAVDPVEGVAVEDAPPVTVVSETAPDVSDAQDDEVDADKVTEAVATVEAIEEAPAVLAENVAEDEGDLTASGEPLSQRVSESEDDNDSTTDEGLFDQSSLSLRYDGTQLSLSGHLADEQMAKLIAQYVADAVPADSELEIKLDGKGKGSPLNWMHEFLATVAGLPGDAQGRIEGSDKTGVQIIPDVEQALVASEPVQVEEATEVAAEVTAALDVTTKGDVEIAVDEQMLSEQTADEAVPQIEVVVDVEESAGEAVSASLSPEDFITGLNLRMAEQAYFAPGDYTISEALQAELGGLIEVMQQNPDLLLRIVGNLDFSVSRREAEYVGIDRAREIRDYLAAQKIEPFRIFATPLPMDRAYDKRVQLVFYISE